MHNLYAILAKFLHICKKFSDNLVTEHGNIPRPGVVPRFSDLEVVFLFPWAISLKTIGIFGYFSMVIFLIILTIGFIYEWKKGALEWE